VRALRGVSFDDPAMKTAVSGLVSMDDGLNKQRATVTHCKVMIK